MRLREITEGVGRITKQNQTVDVGPDEVTKQAAKFGNKVDKDGRPPTLSKRVKGKSTNVLFNLGLAEGYKLQLERDKELLVLHIKDTATGKRTEVRGKPGYETDYDPNDSLHILLDKVGKSANISELMNGEVVTINPKHPDADRAKAATDVAYNEEFDNISEKVKYKSSLSQKVFKPDQLENEGDLTYGLWLPLSNSIVNKIMPKQRARVFHVTSVENISNMLSLQGQKKSISAFLNMDPYFFSQGIFGGGGGGIVFELDSNVLGAFNRDVESSVDDSGRRWITLYALIEYSGKNRNDLQPMYNDMGKLIQRLLDKHAPDMDYTDEYDDYELTTDKWEELGKKLNTDGDGKKLSVVIKDYIDGVYAIMMKYAKPIGQALQSALIDSDPDGDWDEIIVNDIKIMQAHVLKDSTENTEKLKELESKGIKVRVWDSSQELSNYTKKVGAQQKLGENFADGKVKGKSRPGRVKKSGASCNGSVTALRKRAKNASGEKAKMYHWCANMKSGKKK